MARGALEGPQASYHVPLNAEALASQELHAKPDGTMSGRGRLHGAPWVGGGWHRHRSPAFERLSLVIFRTRHASRIRLRCMKKPRLVIFLLFILPPQAVHCPREDHIRVEPNFAAQVAAGNSPPLRQQVIASESGRLSGSRGDHLMQARLSL